jgi:hypothetical protein
MTITVQIAELLRKSKTARRELWRLGAALHELHALLKAKGSGFGGLVRVMNRRQEFLWVHEKIA